MTERPLSAIVLAAGQGTRMKSDRPKPLHVLVGKPMVLWVLDALADCDVTRSVVVVGHEADKVIKRLNDEAGDRPLTFVEQEVRRGTGDATLIGTSGLDPDDDIEPQDVLVLTGDTPLLRRETLVTLVEQHRAADASCTVLTAVMADPTGYGRIVRGRDDKVAAIVEHRDCTDDQLEIAEINTGIFCFKRSLLAPALRRIQPDNAQGELYLTDVVKVLADAGHLVTSVIAADPAESHGINDRLQLAAAEVELRRRINEQWMAAGVTLVDPAHTYIDVSVVIGTDVTIYPDTLLQGRTVIGEHSDIGPSSQLIDCVVGDACSVRQTVADRATIGHGATVGPWASLPPGSEVVARTHTGPHYAGESSRHADPEA